MDERDPADRYRDLRRDIPDFDLRLVAWLEANHPDVLAEALDVFERRLAAGRWWL